jgi:hypothetical protein
MQMQQVKLCAAVLVKDVTYTKDDQDITVKAGTRVFVDVNNHIAMIGADQVDVTEDEYHVSAHKASAPFLH